MKHLDFENFLISKGYKQHKLNHKTKKYEEKEINSYSSMVDCWSNYIKGDINISIGLWEVGYPARVISIDNVVFKLGKFYYNTNERWAVDAVFEQLSNQEILTKLENKEKFYLEVTPKVKELINANLKQVV